MTKQFLISTTLLFLVIFSISTFIGEIKGYPISREGSWSSLLLYIVSLISFYMITTQTGLTMKAFIAITGWMSVLRFVVVGLSLVVVKFFTSLNIGSFAVCLLISYLLFQIVEIYYLIQKLKSK